MIGRQLGKGRHKRIDQCWWRSVQLPLNVAGHCSAARNGCGRYRDDRDATTRSHFRGEVGATIGDNRYASHWRKPELWRIRAVVRISKDMVGFWVARVLSRPEARGC